MTFDALVEECDAKQSQIDAQRLEIERLKRESTNIEAEEPGDKISPNYQTDNVEDEYGLEPDVRQHCSRCNEFLCSEFVVCNCNARYCVECDENDSMTNCRECDGWEAYCNECWLKRFRSGKNDCAECKLIVFDKLLAEYNMKQAQIDSLEEEIGRLRQGQASCNGGQ